MAGFSEHPPEASDCVEPCNLQTDREGQLASGWRLPYIAAAMPDPRPDEDARLQRLADLSIEIRMLKARVQAVMEERFQGDPVDPSLDNVLAFRTALSGARCPHCGHTAGLALLPKEYRRLSTPVRCFACSRDAVAFDWVGSPRVLRTRPHADFR